MSASVSAVDQGKFGVGHVTFDPFEAAEAAAAVMVCTRNESDRPTIRNRIILTPVLID